MNFSRIKELSRKPGLFEKGTAVMWTDSHISKQLLELHLDPEKDIASRNRDKIDLVCNWILEHTQNTNLDILDLGCGPGLYTEYFARRGHVVTGIDFSENSINFASNQAKVKGLDIQYVKKNYLDLDYDNKFDLIVMIYLDFCALIPEERDRILKKIYRALKKGGIFICDVVNDKNLEKKVINPSWEVSENGFWFDGPYISLTKGYHYPEACSFANHHVIIKENEGVDSYIFWNLYYNYEAMEKISHAAGFSEVKNHENILPESGDTWSGENITFYVCRK